jgi:hypothetical protein
MTVKRVREHAKEWGATRIPGTRRWLFPLPLVASLTGMTEDELVAHRKA